MLVVGIMELSVVRDCLKALPSNYFGGSMRIKRLVGN